MATNIFARRRRKRRWSRPSSDFKKKNHIFQKIVRFFYLLEKSLPLPLTVAMPPRDEKFLVTSMVTNIRINSSQGVQSFSKMKFLALRSLENVFWLDKASRLARWGAACLPRHWLRACASFAVTGSFLGASPRLTFWPADYLSVGLIGLKQVSSSTISEAAVTYSRQVHRQISNYPSVQHPKT